MYKCQICGEVSQPGERSETLVTETRKQTYALLDKTGKHIGASAGWEIVQEKRVCPGCHEKETTENGQERNSEQYAGSDGGGA